MLILSFNLRVFSSIWVEQCYSQSHHLRTLLQDSDSKDTFYGHRVDYFLLAQSVTWPKSNWSCALDKSDGEKNPKTTKWSWQQDVSAKDLIPNIKYDDLI